MSGLFRKGPILTYPGWIPAISMFSIGPRKTNTCFDCAEINGIYIQRDVLLAFFFFLTILIALGKRLQTFT